jgi:hypothetical protein
VSAVKRSIKTDDRVFHLNTTLKAS